MHHQPTTREELLARLAVLGEDEQRVLLRIAERLVVGARQYGALDLARDPRVWGREATEELLDGTVYLACKSLQVRP